MNGVIALFFTCFCISLSLSESSTKHQTPKIQTDVALQKVFYNDAWDEGFTREKGLRQNAKKAITQAAKGLIVREKLLTGAKEFRTTKKARYYWKNGDRQTALKDFNSVQPVVTRPNINYTGRRRLNEILIGRVGDRRLVLMLDGDPYYNRYRGHSVVLEIRSAKDAKPDIIVSS